MIGVISKNNEETIITEFFELFKTPWEFYQEHRYYDVVLTTGDHIRNIKTKLLIIYSTENTEYDAEYNITLGSKLQHAILDYSEKEFPVYNTVLTFQTTGTPILAVKSNKAIAGLIITKNNTTIIRVGYNVCDEIELLLSIGQPFEYSYIPSFDLHITFLRDNILDSGIPVLEIPPVPAGYDYITCLTHDVDFVKLRNHLLDHTMFGFIYRALVVSLLGFLRGHTPWDKLKQNLTSVILLPGVFLGLVKDYFDQFDQYIKTEKDLASTFFLVPFKNYAGHTVEGLAPKKRAASYDITEIKPTVQKLLTHGCEIGLHGIDAWRDLDAARREYEQISTTLGSDTIGVRMHWLYYSKSSPRLLEDAGFSYDSTVGYNETIGFKAGTAQVFRPLNLKTLLELPLHIQDTTLFYPARMGLSETQAMERCSRILDTVARYGGVLTINWHQRSLGPERLWKNFYINLINRINTWKVWFGTASDIVTWFKKRRQVTFHNLQDRGATVRIQRQGCGQKCEPPLAIRVYRPHTIQSKGATPWQAQKKYTELLWDGKRHIDIAPLDLSLVP